MPPELQPWMNSVRKMMHDRFCDKLDDATAMIDAFERHNAAVRREIPAAATARVDAADGWDPICERLGLPVPAEPFPVTNTTGEFRAMVGMPPVNC